MKSFLMHLKKLDWPMIIAALLLVAFGLISIYSSSINRDDQFLNFKKQILFLIAAVILMMLFSFFDWRLFKESSYILLFLFFICLILLTGLLFFAPAIRGVRAWYRIGPLNVDPIEFTKIILIILFAKYFSMRHIEMYRVIHIVVSGVYVFLPSLLIFFQPDMGSVLVLLSLWMGVLIISGIKLKHFLILVLIGVLILAFGWSTILKDYQKERIFSFLLPHLSDPLEIGWSQNQAKIALGSGGLFGKGIGKGSQTQHGFLPEPHTDFIFSAIAEETGFFGIVLLLSLFLFLIWRILRVAIYSRFNFCRLFASGFVIVLISQLFIHVGMNLALLPIIGISFPFVSYGGSGLISSFIMLGILQGMEKDF